MNYQKLIKKVEKAVEGIADEYYLQSMLFHNVDRVHYIVKSCVKIASFTELIEEDYFLLMVSAWFYELSAITRNSKSSIDLVTNFLTGHEVDQVLINRVVAILAAVDSNNKPVNNLEEIVRDAITYHFGKKSCLELFELERKEKELVTRSAMDRFVWLQQKMLTLQKHQFYTIYCRQSLEEEKRKNSIELDKMLKPAVAEENIIKKNTKVSDPDKIRPEKAIDGMFRIAESNSQRLSSMADNKAHILITVNSIILSVVISFLLRKLDDNRDLILPTILLLAVSLTSMCFSILSTRPSLPRLTSHPSQAQKENMNLLFFGNFYHMNLESYQTEMHKMMENSALIYSCLIKDIHTEGVVLARKYKLLRTSYNVFMFGTIVATVAFIIASLIQPPKLTATPANNSNKISLHHP